MTSSPELLSRTCHLFVKYCDIRYFNACHETHSTCCIVDLCVTSFSRRVIRDVTADTWSLRVVDASLNSAGLGHLPHPPPPPPHCMLSLPLLDVNTCSSWYQFTVRVRNGLVQVGKATCSGRNPERSGLGQRICRLQYGIGSSATENRGTEGRHLQNLECRCQ